MEIRPRRSVLYLPGSNPRALEKARTLSADTLILDLEDSVAPNAKIVAREQTIAAVRQGGYRPREVVVRVNGLDTPWGRDDLVAVAQVGADAVLLAKVETQVQVERALDTLDAAGAPAGLSLWAMIETPRGVLNADAIATSDERLEVIVMGTSDLAKELRLPPSPQRLGLLAALSQCVLAARAHGLDILDGVHLDLADEVGFEQVCRQGRELGFDGKTLIHPKQIEIANRIFAPDADVVAAAEEIITAWESAQREGRGVVVVNGRLVENLHVEEAKRILALAAAIERLNTGG